MAAGEEAGQDVVADLALADDDTAHFLIEAVDQRDRVLEAERRGGRRSGQGFSRHGGTYPRVGARDQRVIPGQLRSRRAATSSATARIRR